MVAYAMLYFSAIWSAVLNHYVKCPRCGKSQYVKEKKEGTTLKCKKCGLEFASK